jgi:hypothetical protein
MSEDELNILFSDIAEKLAHRFQAKIEYTFEKCGMLNTYVYFTIGSCVTLQFKMFITDEIEK